MFLDFIQREEQKRFMMCWQATKLYKNAVLFRFLDIAISQQFNII